MNIAPPYQSKTRKSNFFNRLLLLQFLHFCYLCSLISLLHIIVNILSVLSLAVNLSFAASLLLFCVFYRYISRFYLKYIVNVKETLLTCEVGWALRVPLQIVRQNGQKEKAAIPARQILNKHIKFHSQAIEETKQEMREIIDRYTHSSAGTKQKTEKGKNYAKYSSTLIKHQFW